MNYLFYDIETTGLNKCFDQIIQFAAIRTDLELRELERYEIFIKLNNDVVPSPFATITHRIGIKQCNTGMNELEAIRHIHQLFNTPGTISVGYNNLNFDDEFLRFSFYRNLLSPYTHQFANQCARMDIYPITVLYYLFKTDALKWPVIHDKPSMRLEHLNASNHLAIGQAHNAMTDVEITLELARRLKQHKNIWEYVIQYFDKAADLNRQHKLPIAFTHNNQAIKEALLIDGKIGYQNQYQIPVLNLGQHLHYKNQNLWLRLDHELLTQCTENNISTHSFIYRKKSGEDLLLLPPQQHYLQYLSESRLQLMQSNKKFLQENPELFFKISHYHRDYTYPKIPNLDADAALYELKFPTPHEEFLFQRFHVSSPKEKFSVAKQFINPIHQELALRILGRHYPEYLPTADKKIYQEYLRNVLGKSVNSFADYRGEQKLTPTQALQHITQLRTQALDTLQQNLLGELEIYLQMQMKN